MVRLNRMHKYIRIP